MPKRSGAGRLSAVRLRWIGWVGALWAAAALATACSGTPTLSCPAPTERFVEYQMFMGRSGPGGEVVDDAAWDAFLDEAVTPRFPDGLTVLDGRGQWRGSDGVIKEERSKLLVILAPPGAEARRLLDEVAAEYKLRFDQEAVLQTVAETCAAFL